MTSTEATDIYTFLVSLRIDSSAYINESSISDRLQGIANLLKDGIPEFPCIHKFKVDRSRLPEFEKIVASRLQMHEGVTTECEMLSSYEGFANELLGVSAALTHRQSVNYVAGLSPLLWCQLTVKFDGRPVEELREIWKKEAIFALETRQKGLKLELYKVVGQRKAHLFVAASPQEWDNLTFKVPLNEEDSGALAGVVKVVQEL